MTGPAGKTEYYEQGSFEKRSEHEVFPLRLALRHAWST
jgi:hypothetical protein